MPVDVAQRHEVLTSGRADVSIVFTTDPQIQRENEVLLEDDKGMFPPYNSTLVMKQTTADEAGPDLAKTIDLIQEQLTDENMQELNARVDLDKKDAAEVAKEYLTETGLIGRVLAGHFGVTCVATHAAAQGPRRSIQEARSCGGARSCSRWYAVR